MAMMAAFRSPQKQYHGRFARNSRWNLTTNMMVSGVRSTVTRRSRWLTLRVPPRVSGRRLTGGWIPTCCSQILTTHVGRRGRRRGSKRALAALHATFVVAQNMHVVESPVLDVSPDDSFHVLQPYSPNPYMLMDASGNADHGCSSRMRLFATHQGGRKGANRIRQPSHRSHRCLWRS
jgi:hypothetical protein